MRRTFLILVWVLCFVMSGCGKEKEVPAFTETISPDTDTVMPSETEPDLMNLFYSYADPSEYKATGCVQVTDNACNLLGIVMYCKEDQPEWSYFDYIHPDGVCVGSIGIGALPAENSVLTYQGEGVITCEMMRSDKSTYLCRIVYQVDENGTNYKVEEG